jgi:hypothetical protein
MGRNTHMSVPLLIHAARRVLQLTGQRTDVSSRPSERTYTFCTCRRLFEATLKVWA